MCGFVGLAGGDPKSLVESLTMALLRIQHRGSESAGASWVRSGQEIEGIKVLGEVNQLTTEPVVSRILNDQPNMIIGHTRYATAGSGVRKNAQPHWLEPHTGRVALALNGDVPNLDSQKRQLHKQAGTVFRTENDAEFILRLILSIIAEDRPDWRNNYIYAIKKVMETLTATFSGGLLTASRMYVFRDRHENRPLFIGQKNGMFVAASETCVFDLMGAQVDREVKGGEIIEISPNGEIKSVQSVETGPLAKCIFESIYFSRPDSKAFDLEKGSSFRRRLGIEMVKTELKQLGKFPEADCVISVPSSGDYFADGYAMARGLPLRNSIMKDAYVGRTFISPGQSARRMKAMRKYTVLEDVPKGIFDAKGNQLISPMNRVVVCDDSIVRLTTMKVLVEKLKKAGYREIHLRISAPPIVEPCYFGIDMKTHGELIAANATVEEIQYELNVNSLIYLPLDRLDQVIIDGGGNPSDYCRRCFGAPCRILS